jgi:hypothetical protein
MQLGVQWVARESGGIFRRVCQSVCSVSDWKLEGHAFPGRALILADDRDDVAVRLRDRI